MLCFLPAVETNPRTLRACQSAAFMSRRGWRPWPARSSPGSSRPCSRRAACGPPSLGRVWRPFSPPRLFSSARRLWLCQPLAAFWPLGAPFFLLAPFFEEAFFGATCAPWAATAAALSELASALVIVVLVFLFCALLAHDDSALRLARNARGNLLASQQFSSEANTDPGSRDDAGGPERTSPVFRNPLGSLKSDTRVTPDQPPPECRHCCAGEQADPDLLQTVGLVSSQTYLNGFILSPYRAKNRISQHPGHGTANLDRASRAGA